MQAQFQWEGVTAQELAEQFQAIEDTIEARMEEAIQTILLRVEGDARRNAPVDTGNLRASLESTVVDLAETATLAGAVGTDVRYAIFQEFGTAVMDAQPFLRPALRDNKDFIAEQLTTAVEIAFEEAGF